MNQVNHLITLRMIKIESVPLEFEFGSERVGILISGSVLGFRFDPGPRLIPDFVDFCDPENEIFRS